MVSAALEWHDAGCAVIPIRADGSKAPRIAWRRYQQLRADREQVERWFTGSPPGLGVVCGAASGGLEMLELEGRAVAEGLGAALVDLISAAGLAELWKRITEQGYTERTPSGGVHVLYRVSGIEVSRNLKLARRPATDAELTSDPQDKIKTLAETRGEGGYTIVAPSHGPVHHTGRPWVVMGISAPSRIPVITGAERDALFTVVRALDAVPPATPVGVGGGTPWRDASGETPGDEFERRTDWTDILGPAGWTLVHQVGRTRYWRRPGKQQGLSATTGRAADRERLYVFSTSTPFDSETPITKLHAYAVLQHQGDHGAAARALRQAGFGGDRPAHATHGLAAEQGVIDAGIAEPRGRVTREAAPHASSWGPSEDGLARALVARHGHELRFCPQRGRWLLWDGCRWAWDDAEQHREFVRELARELPYSGGWRRFKRQALSAGGVSGVVRLARSDPALTVSMTDLDARPYEVNTPGGVVDLRSGVVRPCDPALLHTRCAVAAPDFDRRSERFDRFLLDTFGDDVELARYVQRLIGVSAIGLVLEQVLPLAVGPGANGKSTLLEAAMHALGRGDGGYAIAAPAEMLMVRQHAEHPAELAQLAGARLVVCAELDEGQRFAEARVKQLTGKDSINARYMRRDPFTFLPSHTLWILANHLPAARAGGPAFWRRIRVLPFTRVVPPHRQDKRLGERLATDAPAVLAWIIQGAVAYQREGLGEPRAVSAATDEYVRDSDTVGRFVEEQCRLAEGNRVRAATTGLREAYELWCEQVGERPVAAKRLTQELRARFGVGEARGSKGRRYYTGIALVEFGDESVGLVLPARGDG
jgi:putative DNA primase/helicase